MRKSQERYSEKAKKVIELAEAQGINYWGDPDWALAEAAGLETPIGEVHFHWRSHHGRGNWTIITRPQWRGEICGTVRCRRVTVIPHGGPNESVPIRAKLLDELWEDMNREREQGMEVQWETQRIKSDIREWEQREEMQKRHAAWMKEQQDALASNANSAV